MDKQTDKYSSFFAILYLSFLFTVNSEIKPNCKPLFFPGNPAKPNESFGGDFYKDFYYSQGDYSQEEAQEVKEMKKKKKL